MTNKDERVRTVRAPFAAGAAAVLALCAMGLGTGAQGGGSGAVERGEGGGGAALGVPELRVDLNRAGVDELRLLPRIGPTLAARIVEDRERRGMYRSVEDLERVTGIGPRTVMRVRSLATVGGAGGE